MRSHRFRYCKATTWVDNRPAEARAAALLLGHTNYATSEKYYVRGQMILASGAHNELLDDNRCV
jgi:integrase